MRIEDIRILFFGTPLFASRILEVLYKSGFSICGIITQPTKKAGRGTLPSPSQTKITADKYKLLVYQPASKNELASIVKQIKPDLIVVAAYGKLLPQEVLNIPVFGALNIHGSLLPKYRGSSPIPTAILNGDKETGVTIMKLAEKLDTGPIVSQVNVKIEEEETTGSLYQKLAELGADEIVRIVPLFINGDVFPHEQDHNKATYCSIIRKEDGLINWRRAAIDIERTVRAFNPWPNAYTTWRGRLLKIIQAKVVNKVLEPGYVVSLGKSFLIGCGQDSIEVLRVQIEGKNEMSAHDFLNGYKDIDGTTLS